MATGAFRTVTETQTVTVEKMVHTIQLNDREAQILHCLLSHTKDTDPSFPEVKQILRALRESEAPNYFGMLEVASNDTGRQAHVHIRER